MRLIRSAFLTLEDAVILKKFDEKEIRTIAECYPDSFYFRKLIKN